jgi:hypothetical protein
LADISDVTTTLKTIIAQALYPTAPTTQNQNSPVAGVPVGIQVGWPSPQSVDADRKCGRTTVSLYPLPGERNTTRYFKVWQQVAPLAAATWTLTGSGQTITVGGVAPATYFVQNFAIFVNGKAYIYSAPSNASANSLARALGALIAVDFPGTTVLAAVITLPNNARIGSLRVGTGAPVMKEVRRQFRTIQIMVLSPKPEDRDAVVVAFDPVLADMPRFTLPDNFGARLLYRGSPFNDFDQKFALFRRDLLYDVEYPTTRADVAPEVIAFCTDISQIGADGSTITPPIATPTA